MKFIKTNSMLILLALCMVQLSSWAKEIPQVNKLDLAPNLFQSENMYFGGQPNLETLQWLNKQGVDLVINLRSDNEMEAFAENAFDEKKMIAEMGMKYISIPIDGYGSYTTENVEKLADALKKDYKKTLIHCASCGRVSYFMIAYLAEYKNFQLSEAIEFGKQMKFKFPLEDLLSKEISWGTK